MSSQKNKVILLGSLAYDYIMGFNEKFTNAVSIDHEKEEYQSTVTANSRIQHFGGTAGNIAYNLGMINVGKASLIGSVGEDFENLGYKSHIEFFENIDLALDVHKDDYTAACYIVNDVKANQMIIFHGGALDRCKDIDLKEKITDPEHYSYAINSTQGVDAMINFSTQLHEMGIPIIFDPGQVTPLFSKDQLLAELNKSQILIGNFFEIKQIKEKLSITEDDLLDHVDAIITTKGEMGSQLNYKDAQGKKYKIDIPICDPYKIEDTTGAGDGYRAGILSGLMLGMTLLDSCRLGSVIASFVIETVGAQTQSYTLTDIRKRFISVYGYTPKELEGLK